MFCQPAVIALSFGALLLGVTVSAANAQPRASGGGPNEDCAVVPCETKNPQDPPDPKKKEEHKERHQPISFVTYWVIDAMWMPTQNGDRTVGLIGAHLAIAQIGRVYVSGPPGLIVLRADTENGRAFQTGYTWGFSVYVTDFTFVGTKKRAVLFVNLAKCWTNGDYRNGTNMVGVSVSFKMRK
jgi:hypothetical protein